MFSLCTIEAETNRVRCFLRSRPWEFGCIINLEDLCKYYLYHFVVGNFGIFNDAPILHLPHDNLYLALSPYFAGADVDLIFLANQALYIVTDGEFDLPREHWVRPGHDHGWAQAGPRYGPVFRDHQLQFHCTPYKFKAPAKDSCHILEVLTASPLPDVTIAPAYNYNFRIMRVTNPHVFNYRVRNGRRIRLKGSGPYSPAPSPL